MGANVVPTNSSLRSLRWQGRDMSQRVDRTPGSACLVGLYQAVRVRAEMFGTETACQHPVGNRSQRNQPGQRMGKNSQVSGENKRGLRRGRGESLKGQLLGISDASGSKSHRSRKRNWAFRRLYFPVSSSSPLPREATILGERMEGNFLFVPQT